MSSLKGTAFKYAKSGLSVVPCSIDKIPKIPWKLLQSEISGENEIKAWPNYELLAVAGGKVSGSLTCIDVDCKYDLTGTLFEDFYKEIHKYSADLAKKLVIQKTTNQGYHLIFRCKKIEGNLHLARRETTPKEREKNLKDKVKVLIETRGEGGYYVCYPSAGYDLIQGDFFHLPEISEEDYDNIFQIARSFNQYFKKEHVPNFSGETTELRPGDDYNSRGDALQLLEANGWHVVNRNSTLVKLLRPGDTNTKHSAYYILIGKWANHLIVFSSSTEFDTNKAYSPFSIYTVLNHNGNYQEAAKALAAQGYGKQHHKQQWENHTNQQPDNQGKSENKKPYLGFPMSFNYEIKQVVPAIELNGNPLTFTGEILTILALPGAGKTQVMEIIACSLIQNKHSLELPYDLLGFKINNAENKNILIADTERTLDDSRKSFNRIHKRLGNNPDLINENGFFKDLTFICIIDAESIDQRKEAIENHVKTQNYSLVIIDGILEFCKDGMVNGEDAADVVRWLRALANNYEFAVIVTLHPNKGTETMAGHIGAYLYRYSRACLLIARHRSDDEIKIISRKFPQGKASHAGELNDVFFRYDQEEGLHVLCDEPEEHKMTYDKLQLKKIFNSYLIANGKSSIPSAELKSQYATALKIKDRTAHKHIIDAVKDDVLEKQGSTKNTSYAMFNKCPF